ncbi:MAG: nucleotidyltransferase domain-containing protein [Caulobacter sp.]|nr:nucleotidyltransferase domain-containing protein [Caulobacter sp.]
MTASLDLAADAVSTERDVIERPIDADDLDLGGWDIAKALKLVSRGNAVVSEWLSSPIVYAEDPAFRPAIDDYVRDQMAWGLSHKASEPRRDPALWARTEAAFRELIGAG